MNYDKFLLYVDDAKKFASAEEFLRAYGYPPECPFSPETLVKWGRLVFAVSRGDWRAVVELSGAKSSAAFARSFGVPYSTVRAWIDGRHETPEYIIQLIGFATTSRWTAEQTEK